MAVWSNVTRPGLLVALLLFGAYRALTGCGGDDSSLPDAGTDAGAVHDAGSRDTGPGDAGVADGGHPGAGSCHPLAAGRAAIASAPDDSWHLFDACPRNHFAALNGRELVTDMDGVIAAIDPHRDAILAIPGVIGIGASLCCEAEASTGACVGLSIQSNTIAVPDAVDAIAELLRSTGSDPCVGIRIDVVGATEPRCDGSDPVSCGPLPMCTVRSEPCCPDLPPPADPSAPRARVSSEYDEYSGGACDHDGDCVRLGCGNHCLAWTEPGFFAPCVCLPELATASCGCVDNACTWFRHAD